MKQLSILFIKKFSSFLFIDNHILLARFRVVIGLRFGVQPYPHA